MKTTNRHSASRTRPNGSRRHRRRLRPAHDRRPRSADVVTGLSARGPFVELLREELPAACDRGRRLAVVVIGIDRFASLLDSLGHELSDGIVVQIARRLEEVLDRASLARTRTDEFAVLLRDARDEAEIVRLCEQVLESISTPVTCDTTQLLLTASAGIAFAEAHEDDPQRIVDNAAIALHHASASGGGCSRVYQEALRTRARSRLTLESDLRRALARGELAVHYQPIVDLETGRTEALEALVRWRHPTRGPISPAEFIPIAEETGLVGRIGSFVLDEVAGQMARWAREGSELAGVQVSLNVSSCELADAHLVDSIQAAIERHGIDPSHLWLEITESALLQDWKSAFATASRIRAMGVRFALDDFGTGYSSMLQLKRFPFDAVKIDRSFVAGIGTDSRSTALVESICGLARNLALRVVPEGIETSAQLHQLRGLGCDCGQGFYWSPALSADQLEAWVLRRGRRRA